MNTALARPQGLRPEPHRLASVAARDDPSRHAASLVVLWWLMLLLAVLAWRPLTAIDETRYAAVAWEMWLSGDPVTLRLNGAPYGDKPPLLFWLVNLGWWLVGPNAWWPQVLTALFALGALAVLRRLARHLAPARDALATMTVMITASTLFWMAFSGALMFDTVLSFFVLLAVAAVIRAGAVGGWRPWVAAGLSMGLGILAKGPVALLHVLPLALLAPWWRLRAVAAGAKPTADWARWYGGVVLAVLIAAAIALAWAVPAALAGGGSFGREIFWSQSVDRVATTSHHLRPAWYYAATLPLLLLPWLFFAPVWRGGLALARAEAQAQPGLRAVLAWLLPVMLAFSLFRGKQPHYLLPEVPALAYLIACALNRVEHVRRWESWSIGAVFAVLAALLLVLALRPGAEHFVSAPPGSALWFTVVAWAATAPVVARLAQTRPVRAVAVVGSASVVLLFSGYAGAGRLALANYDVVPMARQLAGLQAAARPIAHFGKYHGQYQFAGRLRQPLQVFEELPALQRWAAEHPDGGVVVYSRSAPMPSSDAKPEFWQKFKGGYAVLWRGEDLARMAPALLRTQAGGS